MLFATLGSMFNRDKRPPESVEVKRRLSASHEGERGWMACWQTLSLSKGRPIPRRRSQQDSILRKCPVGRERLGGVRSRLGLRSRGKPTLPRGGKRGWMACRPIPRRRAQQDSILRKCRVGRERLGGVRNQLGLRSRGNRLRHRSRGTSPSQEPTLPRGRSPAWRGTTTVVSTIPPKKSDSRRSCRTRLPRGSCEGLWQTQPC